MKLLTSVLILIFLQIYSINICLGFGFLAPVGVAVSSIVLGTYCRIRECCSKYSIHANFTGLETDLKKHVYGQHLVQDVLLHALQSHWSEEYKPPKALTLSFHGWPGSGKNYVSSFIINNMYKRGSKSDYVHHFIGRIHFPSSDKVQQYQEELQQWIKGNVSSCGKQLFIFDEVDKMPPNVLNIIKPMIDYRDDVDGLDYRECIFIFLSNTGAELINEHFLHLWQKTGIKREDFKLKDFESLISKGAFNEEDQSSVFAIIRSAINNLLGYFPINLGGFHHSDTIKSNLIDHYIPFLPMERRHVRLCVLDEFRKRNVSRPKEEHIQEVMEFIVWGPSSEQIFSTTGCKRISQKVGTVASKYRTHYY